MCMWDRNFESSVTGSEMWSCAWSNKHVKSCYCARARLSTDQGNLWRGQPVASFLHLSFFFLPSSRRSRWASRRPRRKTCKTLDSAALSASATIHAENHGEGLCEKRVCAAVSGPSRGAGLADLLEDVQRQVLQIRDQRARPLDQHGQPDARVGHHKKVCLRAA